MSEENTSGEHANKDNRQRAKGITWDTPGLNTYHWGLLAVIRRSGAHVSTALDRATYGTQNNREHWEGWRAAAADLKRMGFT